MVSSIYSEEVTQHLYDVKRQLIIKIQELYGDGCGLYRTGIDEMHVLFGHFYGLNEGCALSVYLGGGVIQFYRHLAGGTSVIVEFGVSESVEFLVGEIIKLLLVSFPLPG